MDLINQFAGDVVQRLAWCQIVNAPNLSQKQLDQIKPPHGLFISKDNAGKIGLDEKKAKELGFVEHEQTFGTAEEITQGYISDRIRFVRILKTPPVVESQGELLDFLFAPSGKGLTEIGAESKTNRSYRVRSWWLIAFVDEKNNLISETPIKLALSGGPQVSFNQEINEALEEYEIGLFKAYNQPRQYLNDNAKSFFVFDWKLAPYKGQGKAPYEYPVSRVGAVSEPTTATRYKQNGEDRKVLIEPAEIDTLILSKTSETGKKVLEWKEEYSEQFFSKITNLQAERKAKLTQEEPVEELEEEPSETTSEANQAVPF